jgi:hypothetical protein
VKTHLATVDADAVALAAIQGLNQKLEEGLKAKDSEIAALKQRNEVLENKLNELAPPVRSLTETK